MQGMNEEFRMHRREPVWQAPEIGKAAFEKPPHRRVAWFLFSEFSLGQRFNHSGPTAQPHCSLAQRARSPGKNASRAEGPKQAVGTQLVPGLQPGIAQTQETYGVAIGYTVAAPLALDRYSAFVTLGLTPIPCAASSAEKEKNGNHCAKVGFNSANHDQFHAPFRTS